jgi:hypothetical protein
MLLFHPWSMHHLNISFSQHTFFPDIQFHTNTNFNARMDMDAPRIDASQIGARYARSQNVLGHHCRNTSVDTHTTHTT